jgi:hypothetical protein
MEKNLLPSLILYLITTISIFSCERNPIERNPLPVESNSFYTINGLDNSLWKISRARFKNDNIEDTISIYIDAGLNEQQTSTIILSNILLKQGQQELLGIFKLGSNEDKLPTPNLTTSFHDGIDIIVDDWYYLDTTKNDNWVNILAYNEADNFIAGTFQFTLIRDSIFQPSGLLPDIAEIKDGYFETRIE